MKLSKSTSGPLLTWAGPGPLVRFWQRSRLMLETILTSDFDP